ncbi:MAG: DUF3810 domain-containing protein [Bacteroidales bacterium]
MGRKKGENVIIKWTLLSMFLLVVVIEILKRTTGFADFYAFKIYPSLAGVMHKFSSFVSISLYDLFVTLLIVILSGVIYLLIKRAWLKALFIFIGTFLFVFVFFQLSWGINYFRPDFFKRNHLSYPENDSLRYLAFANHYVEKLNLNFPESINPDTNLILNEAIAGYQCLSPKFNIIHKEGLVRPKSMMYHRLYSSVGILGYYGPFFAEVHVNPDLKYHQYPSVLTHEIAHLNGVTSEAEANLYAYLICINSSDSTSRFSGYYSIFPYVISNARAYLSPNDYRQLIEKINPQILSLYQETRDYWDSLYSRPIGEFQNKLYDIYLKNNNISSGRKNYSEVISMILSVDSTTVIP